MAIWNVNPRNEQRENEPRENEQWENEQRENDCVLYRGKFYPLALIGINGHF